MLMRLLIFDTGKGKYALETNNVYCVIVDGHENISKLHTENRMIEGITEIEGRTSAVINITGFLPRKYTEKDVKNNRRLIVYDVDGELVAFKVKGVVDSIQISSNSVQPPDQNLSSDIFKGVVYVGNTQIPILDPKQILECVC